MVLVRGILIPRGRFDRIALDAVALLVECTQHELRIAQARVGGPSKPFGSLSVVLGYTIPLAVKQPQFILCQGIAFSRAGR